MKKTYDTNKTVAYVQFAMEIFRFAIMLNTGEPVKERVIEHHYYYIQSEQTEII